MTFETFVQSDEKKWHDQKIDKDKYKDEDNDKDNDILRTPPEQSERLVTFEIFVQSDEKTWHDQKTSQENCECCPVSQLIVMNSGSQLSEL